MNAEKNPTPKSSESPENNGGKGILIIDSPEEYKRIEGELERKSKAMATNGSHMFSQEFDKLQGEIRACDNALTRYRAEHPGEFRQEKDK